MRLNEAKLHSHIEYQGLDISVEVPAGGSRHGVNKKTGLAWEHKIDDNYGYIKGTHSPDGEHLDCYLRKNPKQNAMVYVMHQLTVDGSAFDEDKVMLGYSSAEEARNAFKKFTFKPQTMYGGMSEFTMEHFKVIAYQASNSKAMLATEKNYKSFQDKGLLPRGVKSPLDVARSVSESVNEGLQRIGAYLEANHVEHCLTEAGWQPGCMILDVDGLISEAFLYFMESGLQDENYMDDDEFRQKAMTFIMEEDALHSDLRPFRNQHEASMIRRHSMAGAKRVKDRLHHVRDSKERRALEAALSDYTKDAIDATKWLNAFDRGQVKALDEDDMQNMPFMQYDNERTASHALQFASDHGIEALDGGAKVYFHDPDGYEEFIDACMAGGRKELLGDMADQLMPFAPQSKEPEMADTDHEVTEPTNESYSVVLHVQILENIGSATLPQWATSTPRAQLVKGGQSLKEALALADQLKNGEVDAELAPKTFVQGVEVMSDATFRQFHEVMESDESEAKEIVDDLETLTHNAGIVKGEVENHGTPSVHETLAKLQKIAQESAGEETLDEYVMKGSAEMKRAKRVVDATLLKNPRHSAESVVKAVAQKLFDDTDQADEIIAYIENESGMDLADYAETLREQGGND